jgi:hypothetical protein
MLKGGAPGGGAVRGLVCDMRRRAASVRPPRAPPQLLPHSKSESVRPWRLRGGPACASLPNGSESIQGRCSGSVALSSP